MVIGIILVTGASLTASLLVVQMAVIPLLFRYSKSVQRKMVFSNCLNYPRNLDYENPSSSNVVGGRHFNISFMSKIDGCPIKLGVWHMVPRSLFEELNTAQDKLEEKMHEELKKTKKTIVLYCHGNSNHRGSPYRLQIYKVFQEMDFHVVTFDYRGYGDSTHIRPTERGVVEDAYHVYSWIQDSVNHEDRPPVVLWGHSLGTAVVANLSAHIDILAQESGQIFPPPHALVLEAPFNNLSEEIEKHPFSKLVSWLPYYKEAIIKPFNSSSEYAFTTDQYLVLVPKIAILMLHSKSDRIVPYELAVKLHNTVSESREQHEGAAPCVFHTFEKGLGLGHNNLCESPVLKNIVRLFLKLIEPETNEEET